VTVRILKGDVRTMLKTLTGESVNCVVTSPPYFGLRDYGVAGQIGLEASPAEYIETMVDVFREVRRVLRGDGTLWLNIGDSYAGSGRGGHVSDTSTLQGSTESEQQCRDARGSQLAPGLHAAAAAAGVIGRAWVPPPFGLKKKDLVGIPWMLAFALRADGWYLRQDIIWHKPNPIPESVRDRCTKAHEYVFLLSKSERYYYDFDAMQEPSSDGAHARNPGNARPAKGAQAYLDGVEDHRTKGGLHAFAERKRTQYKTPDGWDTSKGEGGHGSFHKDGREKGRKPAANWKGSSFDGERDIAVRPDKGRKIAEAGSGIKNNDSFDDAMAVMPESRNKRSVWTVSTKAFSEAHFATFPPALIEPCILAGCPQGGVVLDPFFGAGTTGLVADRHGRDCIGIELNPEYADMAEKRIRGDSPLFAEVA